LRVKFFGAILLLLAGATAFAQEALPANAQLVSFPAVGGTLNGFLYVPAGPGPFPAVLWNHGSEKRPGAQPELAEFYNSHGFVFFLPHRRGQGRSPGTYIMDEIRSHPSAYAAVQTHRDANNDVVAALNWLRAQKQVDSNRIVVSGCSFGGIQTILTAEKGLGARAFIAFAPAAQSWGNPALEQMLGDALRKASAPVFILQARNDFSIQPAQVLGKIAKGKGGQSTIYPPFGETHEDGHWKFATTQAGIAIWGEDVLNFIKESFR
jgi:carboxymethylenebutenolidase